MRTGLAKSSQPLSARYSIDDRSHVEDEAKGTLMVSVIDELRELMAERLEANGKPKEAADYLVSFDPVTYVSTPPSDLLFSFRGEVVPLEKIDPGCVGFDIKGLLDTFAVNRIFVPREYVDEAREYVDTEYRI